MVPGGGFVISAGLTTGGAQIWVIMKEGGKIKELKILS